MSTANTETKLFYYPLLGRWVTAEEMLDLWEVA